MLLARLGMTASAIARCVGVIDKTVAKAIRWSRIQAEDGPPGPPAISTHRFRLAEIERAYDTSANAGRERALKVVLTNA